MTVPYDTPESPPAPPTPARPDDTVRRGAGRVLDFTLAGLLLILTAPLTLTAALLIKLTSRGPVLYTQIRLGLHRRPFTLVKLRTMAHNCEAATGARWSAPHDPRVTLVGRLLRQTHIDELPQLWNVLRGDMSLVGPRPERPEFVAQLEPAIPGYGERLTTWPGLTGLAQIQLPPDTNLESVQRKLRYDLFYLEHASLGLDLRIVAGTAFHVLGLPFAVTRVVLGVPGVAEVEPEFAAAALAPRMPRLGDEPVAG
jgi:lipopolysaccharide/colanic/teichoic acid biosynthesis glycosyltransferase